MASLCSVSEITFCPRQIVCLMIYPHNQIPIQLAMTTDIVAAIGPTPIKLGGITVLRFAAIFMTPEIVKPEGPTDMNMPGRSDSLGSFCVMRRYRNAA